jgi:hypothetical protein
MKIAELYEGAPANKFGLMLKWTDLGTDIGWYAADDESPSRRLKKARAFDTKEMATAEAKIVNGQWDLARGQKFIVQPLSYTPKWSRLHENKKKPFEIAISDDLISVIISPDAAETEAEARKILNSAAVKAEMPHDISGKGWEADHTNHGWVFHLDESK